MVNVRALLPQLEDSEPEALWNKSDMYSMAFWPISSAILLAVISRAPISGFAVSLLGSRRELHAAMVSAIRIGRSRFIVRIKPIQIPRQIGLDHKDNGRTIQFLNGDYG